MQATHSQRQSTYSCTPTRSDDPDPEARFLTLAQALETFSRAQGHAEYMPKEQWKPIAAQIIASIPGEVKDDHRASLKGRIGWGFEYALHKRIRLLLKSLGAEAQEIVCKSSGDFVDGVKETRNYLTHYSTESKPQALQGVDLAWACERVLMLMRILLLKELGIDEAVICRRIKEHGLLSQHIHRYRQYPERVK